MLLTTRFAVILVATAFSVVALPQDAPNSSASSAVMNATASMSAMPGEPTLSPCLQQCYMQASKASGCTLFDHACICPSQSFANATVACLSSFCPDEIQGVLTQQSGDCATFVSADVLSSIDAGALANTGSVVPPTPSATNAAGASGSGVSGSGASQASQASQTKNAAVGGGDRVVNVFVAVAVLVGMVF